jgi:triphosphatase
MEIEAKFRVSSRAIFADLLRLTSLGPYDLESIPGIEHQHNTYFDTSDRRLAALRYTLRVRDLGIRRIATVKHSLGTQAGIHRREEWEVEIGAGDHPQDWPAGATRDRALAMLAGAPISPLVTIHTRRQYIYALHAGSRLAELSLDEGTIIAGGRTTGFRELEVELLAGATGADLDALIGCLHERFPLIPESRGKKARGMALLDRALGTLASHPARYRQ